MNDVLKTEITVDFGKGDEGVSHPISIGPGFGTSSDSIPLIIRCPVAFSLAVTAGSIVPGPTGGATGVLVPVPAGVVTFNNSTSAGLPSPGNAGFSALFVMNEKGETIPVSFHYDPATFSIVASRPCYAVVKYNAYTTPGKQVWYAPQVTSTGGGGVLVTYGIVIAYTTVAPISMATYQVPIPSGPEQVDIEIYRRVSDALTTDEGQLEYPPNYPKDGKYPGKSYEADISKCLKMERVHEIGIMTPTGSTGVRTYYVQIRKPYEGDPSYKPTLRCIPAQLPEGISASDAAKAKSAIAGLGYGCKE